MITFKYNTDKVNPSQDGFMSRLHSRNARHRSEQNHWSSHKHFKIATIKLCKTIVLHFTFMDVKSGLSHYGGGKQCVFHNRLLMKLLKGKEIK